MPTEKLVALLAGLVVLASVIPASAGGDQGAPAILNELRIELNDIRARLDALVNALPAGAPDLVPNPYFHHYDGFHGPQDFCRILDSGKLWVSVYNPSGYGAGPSVTQVFFRVPADVSVQRSCGVGCAEVDIPTPAMGPFGSVELAADVPQGCFGTAFGPDDVNNCQFKINVDGTNVVNESTEFNNTAMGACQGLL